MLDRRRFLALAAGILLARRSGGAEAAVPASVTVAYEDPGRAFAPDFIGLSYESALVASPDYLTPDNVSLLGLLRRLGGQGIIRIGGNTSERTVWETGEAKQTPGRYVITPAAVDRLRGLLPGRGLGAH